MSKISRRQLLKIGALGAAGVVAAPYFIPSGVLAADDKPGANDRIALGAIGVGGRANLLLDQLPDAGRIVALCDCNLPRADEYKNKKKGDWAVYQDYRKLLERKDIDAVIIATGDFQRVLPCIHACQAGKDIYAEKPLTLYIQEGRVLVDAVRKYKRVFQSGTQQRSMAMNRIACELIRSGGLGKVLQVETMDFGPPQKAKLDQFPQEPTPAGLDWDRWLGQAEERPFNGQWMGWMNWYDFGGGQMTNWGAHAIDQVQWALGTDDSGPVEMWMSDGKPSRIEMRYANGVPLKFNRESGHGPAFGAVFTCEKGKLEINRNKFASNPKEIAVELLKKVDAVEEEKKWSDQTALWQAKWHIQNWFDCIKTREKPISHVETGHRSNSLAHLANITRELNRRLKWDPAAEKFIGDDEANKLVTRARRKGYELPEKV